MRGVNSLVLANIHGSSNQSALPLSRSSESFRDVVIKSQNDLSIIVAVLGHYDIVRSRLFGTRHHAIG
jgi:hypothetical protein